jgi:hypothetical protein
MHWIQQSLNRQSSLSYPLKLIQQYDPHFSCCVTHIELSEDEDDGKRAPLFSRLFRRNASHGDESDTTSTHRKR